MVTWCFYLAVSYPNRVLRFWRISKNLQHERKVVLETQPQEMRRFMSLKVMLVQMGSPSLATIIRHHGSWIYYAQRINFCFALDVRGGVLGGNVVNVCPELVTYVEQQYGCSEHPGKALDEWFNAYKMRQKELYVPTADILKRYGRSDIAFAIHRFQAGMEAFASRIVMGVAVDILMVSSYEAMIVWPKYVAALVPWMDLRGALGTILTKLDLILTVRHDLRHAMVKHGGPG